MTETLTTIRVDTNLVDEAVRLLGVKTRTEAVRVAIKEMIGPRRLKKQMKKHALAGFLLDSPKERHILRVQSERVSTYLPKPPG